MIVAENNAKDKNEVKEIAVQILEQKKKTVHHGNFEVLLPPHRPMVSERATGNMLFGNRIR